MTSVIYASEAEQLEKLLHAWVPWILIRWVKRIIWNWFKDAPETILKLYILIIPIMAL